MKLCLLNSFSALNTGDAAIVLGTTRLLREVWPRAEITITSVTPELDAPFYADSGIDVLPAALPALSHYNGIAGKLAGGTRELLAASPKRDLVAAIRSSDLVAGCGGGSLFSYRRFFPGSSFWQNYAHLRLALALRKPLLLMPQSFGPFRSAAARHAVAVLLEHPRVVCALTREEVSTQILRELVASPLPESRITVCPDMAFYLDVPAPGPRPETDGTHSAWSPARASPRSPMLAVAIRDWLFPDATAAGDRVARRASYLEALCEAVVFFVTKRDGEVMILAESRGPSLIEDDRVVSQELLQRLQSRIPPNKVRLHALPLLASPHEVATLLARADVVIGARLHACILAMLAGVPAIAIGYQPKSAGVLDGMGLRHLCVDMGEIRGNGLIERLAAVLDDRERLRGQILSAVAAARARIVATLVPILQSCARGSP